MICEPCGEEIEPRQKFFAIFKTRDGLRIGIGCEHYDASRNAPPGEKLIATVGSFGCLNRFMESWQNELVTIHCDHKGVIH